MIGLLGGVLLQGLGRMAGDYFKRGQIKAANALSQQQYADALEQDGLTTSLGFFDKYQKNQQRFMEDMDIAEKVRLQQEQADLQGKLKDFGFDNIEEEDVNQHMQNIRNKMKTRVNVKEIIGGNPYATTRQ